MAVDLGSEPKATTAQWLYTSVFGASSPDPSKSSEPSNSGNSMPVIDVEQSKKQFAERNKIGDEVKGSPGGKAWTLTSKDLMKETPGGVAWNANPEEVVDPTKSGSAPKSKTAAQTMKDVLGGTSTHVTTTFEVIKRKILSCLPRVGHHDG